MDNDPKGLRPITINLNVPEPLVQAMEAAAREARLAPADWVLKVIAKEVGMTIEFFDGPQTIN